METLNAYTHEMSMTEVLETEGGKLTLNQARLVAFCIGGVVGLALFELARNT